MNKSAKVALVAAAVALAYPVSSWFLGQSIESRLEEQYSQIGNQPYLKIAERKYERGVFSATDTVTFEIPAELFAPVAPDAEEPDAPAEAAKPLRITVRTRIQHGPLPGLSTVAAAVADSELVFDDKTRQEIAKVLGDRKPLELHTVYRFDGGGTGTLSSPAFTTSLPESETRSATRVVWQGFNLDVDFSAGMKHYTMKGSAPKLEIEDDEALVMLAGFTLTGDQQRLFDDDATLYVGTQKFAVGEMSFTSKESDKEQDVPANIVFKDIAYEVDAPANGDFLDISARMGAKTVSFGEHNFGPVHYDLSFKHLHARTTSKLYRAAMELYSDKAAAENPGAALAALSDPALELLSHSPEFSIDRISFTSTHGEAKVAARVKLAGIQPDDFSNAFALIGKIDASGEAALPRALLTEWVGDGDETSPESMRVTAQLDALAAQGLLNLDAGMVKSTLVFRQGQLTINGKPFNPLALGGLAGGLGGDDEEAGYADEEEMSDAAEEMEADGETAEQQ